ncbi:hypothetical protein B0T19DRAFT_467604 [Cercophora scortea]|uniref:Uncharacterized protein n=1 Tax=Cercophora scortea TaxID=314031 RepID=A0AAE0I7N6_9PEZI|nr:hypothetical protein B0T19DRAFT_467604 [Cercophora scortea]
MLLSEASRARASCSHCRARDSSQFLQRGTSRSMLVSGTTSCQSVRMSSSFGGVVKVLGWQLHGVDRELMAGKSCDTSSWLWLRDASGLGCLTRGIRCPYHDRGPWQVLYGFNQQCNEQSHCGTTTLRRQRKAGDHLTQRQGRVDKFGSRCHDLDAASSLTNQLPCAVTKTAPHNTEQIHKCLYNTRCEPAVGNVSEPTSVRFLNASPKACQGTGREGMTRN